MNMPILYRNIMDGLPSDLSRAAFLWATEQCGEDRMCYQAERFAREVDGLHRLLTWLLSAGFAVHRQDRRRASRQSQEDLMKFILKRHANFVFGGNRSAAFLDILTWERRA